MKIKITKNYLYSILFGLCVSVPYLNNYELTFAVWGLTTGLTLRRNYGKQLVWQITLFTLILAIAFFSSFFHEYATYNYIRDITYLAKPILGFLIGYQLCKTHIKKPFETIVYTGVFLAVLHLLIVFYGFVSVGFSNVHQIRSYAGYFSDFEVYVILILIFYKSFKINIPDKQRNIFLGLLILSAAFYLSRTNFIQFAILYMALKGYFVPNKKNITALLGFLLFGFLCYSAVVYYNPKRNGEGLEAFLYKVKIAPTEPFKTKINREDYKDFHDNYRSVENINTYNQIKNKGTSSVLFGKGLGSKVDLRKEVWLDGTLLRFISVLHNGFMTVYLKSGLIGVAILLLSIFLLFRKQKTNIPELTNINYLMTGSALFLFISYWVFMGFYFKADTKAVLIGLLIALSERIKSESNHSSIA